MAENSPLLKADIPGLARVRSGKVREMFDLGEHYLMVATDRISAFDVIMAQGIPRKGRILTQLSKFWFDLTREWLPNHLVSTLLPDAIASESWLQGRCMVVRKSSPLPIECVARGYLAGSGWKEYQSSGTLAGEPLPPGLRESERLSAPRFTPATKAESGHDINITRAEAARLIGASLFEQVEDITLRLYSFAHEYAASRGILLADTKFEFGLFEDQLLLIDEALTPDSSRFWPSEGYQPGKSQPSFDKQFLRDYLESLDWNKCPPPPPLPDELIARTSEKYLEAFQCLTGQPLP